MQEKRERIPYKRDFAVGEALCFLEDEIVRDPDALYTEGCFWTAEPPEEMVRDLGRWLEKVRDWVKQPVAKGASKSTALVEAFVRIVVTADRKATVVALERRELWGEEHTRIEALDAGEKSCPSWGGHVESQFGHSTEDSEFRPGTLDSGFEPCTFRAHETLSPQMYTLNPRPLVLRPFLREQEPAIIRMHPTP